MPRWVGYQRVDADNLERHRRAREDLCDDRDRNARSQARSAAASGRATRRRRRGSRDQDVPRLFDVSTPRRLRGEIRRSPDHARRALATTMDVAQLGRRGRARRRARGRARASRRREGAHVVAAVKDPYMRFQSRRRGPLRSTVRRPMKWSFGGRVCAVMTTLFRISLSALFRRRSRAFKGSRRAVHGLLRRRHPWVDTMLWANAAGFFGIAERRRRRRSSRHDSFRASLTWMGRNIGIFMSPVTAALTARARFSPRASQLR